LEPRILLSQATYSYVTNQGPFQVGAGKSITVNVYLKESLNGSTSLISGNGENGLLSAGFEVVSDTPASAVPTVVFNSANGFDPASINVIVNNGQADVMEHIPSD